MSKRYWLECGYGFAIADDDPAYRAFMEAAAKDMALSPDGRDIASCIAGAAYWDSKETKGTTFRDSVSGSTCTGDKSMFVIWADRQPDFFDQVYTKESVTEEFRKKVGDYLPEDFDYLSHIGYFSAAVLLKSPICTRRDISDTSLQPFS